MPPNTLRVISSGTFAGASQWHAESVALRSGDDRFAGALLRPGAREAKGIAAQRPLLARTGVLLAPASGFLAAMSEAFETDLTAHLERVLVIERLCSSLPFISDAECRRAVLNEWSSEVLCAPGFVVIHPPATHWQAEDLPARFQLGRERRKDLELCVLFGSLGAAQICDDVLEHPIPLMVMPWTPERGLLVPRRLPAKSFSQTLCVQRIGRRRLLLFDRHSAPAC